MRPEPQAPEERSSPWPVHAFLLVSFAAILVIAVFTVLIPEIQDTPDEETTHDAGAADSGH